MANELHHNKSLAALYTEVAYSRLERSWQRRRDGKNSSSRYHREVVRRYNKAWRKASKVQLGTYHDPKITRLGTYHSDQQQS